MASAGSSMRATGGKVLLGRSSDNHQGRQAPRECSKVLIFAIATDASGCQLLAQVLQNLKIPPPILRTMQVFVGHSDWAARQPHPSRAGFSSDEGGRAGWQCRSDCWFATNTASEDLVNGRREAPVSFPPGRMSYFPNRVLIAEYGERSCKIRWRGVHKSGWSDR